MDEVNRVSGNGETVETATPDKGLEQVITLLRSLDLQARGGGDPGLTTKELAARLRLPVSRCRELIRVGLTKGLLLRGRALEETISGSMQAVPVYRPAGE